MSLWIFDESLPVWQEAKKRQAKKIAEEKAREELAILKYKAKCDVEEWCRLHDIPKNHIRETEKGFKVIMEFKY